GLVLDLLHALVVGAAGEERALLGNEEDHDVLQALVLADDPDLLVPVRAGLLGEAVGLVFLLLDLRLQVLVHLVDVGAAAECVLAPRAERGAWARLLLPFRPPLPPHAPLLAFLLPAPVLFVLLLFVGGLLVAASLLALLPPAPARGRRRTPTAAASRQRHQRD